MRSCFEIADDITVIRSGQFLPRVAPGIAETSACGGLSGREEDEDYVEEAAHA